MNTTHRPGRTTLALDPKRVALADQMRLDRLARELRLTNQILSGDLAEVAVQHGGPAPAWTSLDGEVITFALDYMPMPSSRLDVAVWLGTNAHELGHVLFSPRADAPLVVRLRSAGEPSLLQLHNIVEDQRQERLILARFAPWRGYLVAALGHHIVADDENAWLLLCGRTWLPAEVRAKAREAFVKGHGETAAALVASCVGRYQHLADPGHGEADEAWTILETLLGLLPTPPRMRQMCSNLTEGEPDTSGAEAGAPDTADEADGEAPGGGGEADGEGEGEGGGDAQGAGTGAGSGGQDVGAEIRQAATTELVGADLDAVMDALDHGRGTSGAVGEPPRGHYHEVTDAARRLHREVADALLDLHDDNEPGWVRRVDAGRLNVGRLASGAAIDQLFDAYQPGHLTANEVEVVLLLDVSASMTAHLASVGEATWAIRHAVDDLDGTLTAITWSDGPHRILAAPGDRPDDRMFVPASEGGTDPETALAEAYRLLSTSDCTNRLVVILTDGSWTGNAERTEGTIDAMNDAGIVTVCALLGRAAGGDLHRCTFGRALADLPDLARLFGEVAAARMSQGDSY